MTAAIRRRIALAAITQPGKAEDFRRAMHAYEARQAARSLWTNA